MYLVFDIGGTFVKYGLLDDDGNIYEKGKMPTYTDDKPAFLNEIHEIYLRYKKYNLSGIALSMPGMINIKMGTLERGGAIRCMYNCCITEEISGLCDGVRVSVENDGNCAGLAEAWIGSAKDVQNCCVLVFGTGVASSVIINKQVLHGSHLIAGEASYLVTNPDLKNMDIHRFGTEYSTGGIIRKTREALNNSNITGEMMFELYEKGDERVVNILENFFFHVACQCYNLQAIVDPDLICIGGGISEQKAVLQGICKYLKLIYNNTKQFRIPTVVNCRFGNDSNLIGALYHFKQVYNS